MSETILPERSLRQIRRHCCLADDARAQLRDAESPKQFIERLLLHELLVDATYVVAFLMPARQAIWWGCVCIDQAQQGKHRFRARPDALARVVSWVADPTVRNRLAASDFARAVGNNDPIGSLAKAASHGLDEQRCDNPAPHPFRSHRLTGNAVRACGADGRLPSLLAIGLRMLEGDHRWQVAQENQSNG